MVDATTRSSDLPLRRVRRALVVCFLLAPVVSVSLVLAVYLHATLVDCIANGINDEITYWNEIAAVAKAGFHGGYVVCDERPAKWSLFHFGPHGPGFPVVYGSLARVLGWYPVSGPFFNLLVLSLSAAVWLWCCRLDATRLAIAALFMATLWSCVLWLPSLLQESLHCSIAFLLAGLAHAQVNGEGNKTRTLWLFLVVVAGASLIRITWVLVLFPWACVALRGVSWRVRVFILATIVCMVPALALIWGSICAPYANSLDWVTTIGQQEPRFVFWTLLWRLWYKTLPLFFSLSYGNPLQILQRYETVGVILIGLLFGLQTRRVNHRPYLFASLNMLLIAGLVIVLYEMEGYRDYRVFTPHLLMSYLLLLSGPGFRWVLGMAAIHLLFAPTFITQFLELHRQRVNSDMAAIVTFREQISPFVAYDPAASAWNNTLLVPEKALEYPLLGVPPGVGITFAMDPARRDRHALQFPLKSKYVIETPKGARLLQQNCHLQFLSETILGGLYLNLDRQPDQ
jgi:hypothetical protein